MDTQSYTPVDLQKRFHTQAYRVWMITSTVVLLWVAVIIAVPLFASGGMMSISSPIYSFFSYICHQIPERSFHLAGHQMGVCSRCFGVYFGLLAGTVVYPLWRSVDSTEPLKRFWLLLSMVPIGIDWSLGAFGIWENTHLTRVVTGAILGFACGTFIMPALVEIARNMSSRRTS